MMIKSKLYLLITVISIVFLLQFQMQLVNAQTIKVMSFNIRMSYGNDGVNNWENRKGLVIRSLRESNPDIIGMQEVTSVQYKQLRDELKDYDSYAVGRKDGKLEDEIMSIFYKKGFDLVVDSTIWLSKSPTEIGSKSWDAALYRTVSWVKLKTPNKKHELTLFNTHFDHMGTVARAESAKLIMKLVSQQYDYNPVIVTGDFNITQDEEPYQILVNNWKDKIQLYDARGRSKLPHQGGEVTYNGYKHDSGKIIDFIFISESIEVESHKYLNIKEGELFISDHYPVIVDIVLLDKPVKTNSTGDTLK